MSETYTQRAKRLDTDPTKECIACGEPPVLRLDPQGGYQFCKTHLDWETRGQIYCEACSHTVGLVCNAKVEMTS